MSELIDKAVLMEKMHKYGFTAPDMTVHEFIEDELPTIPATRWVRCEEEMPKEMKVVVTYGKGRVSFGYCMFLYDADMEKDVCEWVDTHSNRMEVTHWMPLPEPPMEDA